MYTKFPEILTAMSIIYTCTATKNGSGVRSNEIYKMENGRKLNNICGIYGSVTGDDPS